MVSRHGKSFMPRFESRGLARRSRMVAAGMVASVCLAACGGGGNGAAAVVGGQTVSKAAVAHWVPIEAVISRELDPQQPVPKGEVPDPPQYTACIAYTRATGGDGQTAQLEHECQQRYETVRTHMITILISFLWMNAETKAHGISVSSREVERGFAGFKREVYGSQADFERYLKYTGETLADELLISKINLLSTKLRNKLISSDGIAAASKFYRELPRRWAAKTSCSSGYIVPDCKQYKGPRAPEVAI